MKHKIEIVSTKEGYSFFLERREEDLQCTAMYKTGKHMTGQGIADSLGVTRVAVSQTLKRSLRKIYYDLKKKNRHLTPIEIIGIMGEICQIKTEKDYKKFFSLFPTNIKQEVSRYAYESGYTKN